MRREGGDYTGLTWKWVNEGRLGSSLWRERGIKGGAGSGTSPKVLSSIEKGERDRNWYSI